MRPDHFLLSPSTSWWIVAQIVWCRTRLTCALPSLLVLGGTFVGHVPNASAAIVGHEQASVFSGGDADRSAPDGIVIHNKSLEEVLVAAVGFSVVHRNANYLIASVDCT
jgi:hypothetical protein